MTKQPLTNEQEAWLAALETSKLPDGTPIGQCRGALRYQAKSEAVAHYCCLGVATQMFDPDSRDLQSIGSYRQSIGAVATEETVQRLGLYNGAGISKEGTKSLVGANDGGKTFKEIAAIIRDDPSDYFIIKAPKEG